MRTLLLVNIQLDSVMQHSAMLPGTAMPKPLQQALGLKRAEVTQASIAAMLQLTTSELRAS